METGKLDVSFSLIVNINPKCGRLSKACPFPSRIQITPHMTILPHYNLHPFFFISKKLFQSIFSLHKTLSSVTTAQPVATTCITAAPPYHPHLHHHRCGQPAQLHAAASPGLDEPDLSEPADHHAAGADAVHPRGYLDDDGSAGDSGLG